MSEWYRNHLDEKITALAIPDNRRFWVQMREHEGGSGYPAEFFRWNLRDAQKAADRLVQAYHPHECEESRCGQWRKSQE